MPNSAEENAATNCRTAEIIEAVSERLQVVRDRIGCAAAAAGRPAGDIRLIAVSKTFPAPVLRAAYVAGQRDFGENYVQEALPKMDALADLPLVWHFIGPIQSNKTRAIAERFDWVHSIDREKTAQRLARQRPASCAPLQVCIQVNVSGESTKSGADPADVPALARAIQAEPRLVLRGLMAIPAPEDDPVQQRAQCRRLAELLDATGLRDAGASTLSMGMSDDLESAIAEGATMVRIGRAIFGERAAMPAPEA